MKKRGLGAFLRRKQYVIAGALVIAAAVATTIVYSNEQEKERERMEAELAEELNQERQAAELAQAENAEKQEETAETANLTAPKAAESTEETESTENMESTETAELEGEYLLEEEEAEQTKPTAAKAEKLHFSPEDGMNWPLQGNVILNYSMDATIYFPTLEQYKYNPAVIIEGDVNSDVYSVARGKVTSVRNDEVTGCTMTVDLGDGYQAIYGQLKELNFKEGDYVEAGHVLGYVGEPTKYFSVEGSNLYFELRKEGVPVNPIAFFE